MQAGYAIVGRILRVIVQVRPGRGRCEGDGFACTPANLATVHHAVDLEAVCRAQCIHDRNRNGITLLDDQ